MNDASPRPTALPYERGAILPDTADDVRKLEVAWQHMAARYAGGDAEAVYGMTGLDRALHIEPEDIALMDDDMAPAHCMAELGTLAMEHLGADPARHDVMLLNRQTAALWLAARVMLRPGDRVVGASPTYSHPAVVRAVADAGAELIDVAGLEAFERVMDSGPPPAVVMLTRLAVSYEILGAREIERIIERAREAGAKIVVDDAGGARVGPAIFGQPRSLELDVDVASTGLDKYGTTGPRLGLLGGERGLVSAIRAKAFEMGMEARPMLYPAVVRSLRAYRPERVRELVECTRSVAAALKRRIGGNRVVETQVIAKLPAEDILDMALTRAGLDTGQAPIVPYEATAALAMLLLRDHGIFTVHFAGLPPGTSALLIKFIPPETLARLGGAERFAVAVDESLQTLAGLIDDPEAIRSLLLDTPQPRDVGM